MKNFDAPRAAAIRQKAAAAASCQVITLPSGLTVLCRTMPGYSTVHAMYAADFGAVTRNFTLDGRPVSLPAGTAHFLEHKMFESDQGDAFDLYAKTGASANAFTGYDRTCYIFSATGGFDENLDILLGMVGHPYFTEATIAKEQGIIGQEIKMYEDSPDWRLLTALFRCLYRQHPIRDDIAGTVQSIATLTPEILYDCTTAFYRPGNMVLSVAGNIAPEQVLRACQRAGLDEPAPAHTVSWQFLPEDGPIPQKEATFTMPVTKPCFALGYREAPLPRGDARQEILCDILPELICGGMTTLYRRLYDESLVNPDFGGDTVAPRGCCCIAFTGESAQPRKVAELLRQEIDRLRREGVDEELFTLVKNQMYGELLADLECVEDAAAQMAGAQLKGRSLASEIETLAALTVEDANKALQTMLREENSAYVQIDPQ
ncbi:MAG: pitrilysin family protein [Gemmiger sp.]|nr:pitrilysin family protein [Gemmiger sp.]